jgi:hypothetical protein
MLWNTELSKFKFVSQNNESKVVLCASDLCHLFCVGDLENKSTMEQHPVLQPSHVKAVAEFVNKEMV